MPDSDLRGIGFAASDYQHVRHFLQLRFPDFEVDLSLIIFFCQFRAPSDYQACLILFGLTQLAM